MVLPNSFRQVSKHRDGHLCLSKEQLFWELAAWHRRKTRWSPWTEASLSLRHADNLCSRLCTFHPRIRSQWSVAPLPVIMQSALFFICIHTFERKLRNGQESNLEEYAYNLCLPSARQDQKRDLKISLNIKKKGIWHNVSLAFGYWQTIQLKQKAFLRSLMSSWIFSATFIAGDSLLLPHPHKNSFFL